MQAAVGETGFVVVSTMKPDNMIGIWRVVVYCVLKDGALRKRLRAGLLDSPLQRAVPFGVRR